MYSRSGSSPMPNFRPPSSPQTKSSFCRSPLPQTTQRVQIGSSKRPTQCSPVLSCYTHFQVQSAPIIVEPATYTNRVQAVIAFVGAFVLVTYKLKEEKEEQTDQETQEQGTYRDKDGIWCANPRLEQVGSLRRQSPPTELLKAAHSIAIATAFVGFLFVVVGIICCVWAQQSRSVSIFSSATLLVCILVSLGVVNPLSRAEKAISGKL